MINITQLGSFPPRLSRLRPALRRSGGKEYSGSYLYLTKWATLVSPSLRSLFCQERTLLALPSAKDTG